MNENILMDNSEGLVGFYINLETRHDRREHFETNVKCHPIFSRIERMNAIYRNDITGVGCTLSHIESLRMIKKYDNEREPSANYYMIFEDDFLILNIENFNDFVNSFENIRNFDFWDVIVLTPSGIKQCEGNNIMTSNGFSKIIKTQTATGYIFKSHMIDVLIDNLIDSYINLIDTHNYQEFALDQYWKKLQSQYDFYYYEKIFGGQLPGWSNLENRYVDYNHGFLSQK